MTEYDFSPEAYDHYLALGNKVASWADDYKRPATDFSRHRRPPHSYTLPPPTTTPIRFQAPPISPKAQKSGIERRRAKPFLCSLYFLSESGTDQVVRERLPVLQKNKLDDPGMHLSYANPAFQVGYDTPSFAANTPNGNNFPVPNLPAKTHQKPLPHDPLATSQVPTKNTPRLNNLYRNRQEGIAITRSDIDQEVPIQEALSHPTFNAAETPPGSLVLPGHPIPDIDTHTKSHLAPDQQPDPRCRHRELQPHPTGPPNPLSQQSEIPVSDSTFATSPSQHQLAAPDAGAVSPVGDLYAQIKEHAAVMVGVSGVLGGVAFHAVCLELKIKGHPRICSTLSALRIYSILLNIACITTLAVLLLFIPQDGGKTLSSRYLWLLWVGLFVLSSIFTFFQILLFSWPEGVQVGVLIFVTAICVVAGLIFWFECYARSRKLVRMDIEQGNL